MINSNTNKVDICTGIKGHGSGLAYNLFSVRTRWDPLWNIQTQSDTFSTIHANIIEPTLSNN